MANIVPLTLAGHPFFLQKETGDPDPIYYSALDMRRFFTGLMPRSGVLGSSHFLVQQADQLAMSIKVNSGYANVGGKYLVYLDTDQTMDLSGFSSSPTTTRTHKVFISIYDGLIGGDVYAATVDVVEDTGGGAPAPPGAAVYLQIATISVAPNQGNIQNVNINNMARHGGAASEYVYLEGLLNAGFANAGDDIDAAAYRAQYSNGRVYLSGAIKRTGGTAFANGSSYDIGAMHSNLIPVRTRYMTGACSLYASSSDSTGSYTWRLTIAADGAMTANLPTGTGPLYLMFDGMSYDLD